MWRLLALLDLRFQAYLPGRPNVYNSAAEATGRFIAHTGRAAGRPAEQGAVGIVGGTPRSAGSLARRCGSRRGAPTWARRMDGGCHPRDGPRPAGGCCVVVDAGSSHPRDVTRRRPIGGRPGEPVRRAAPWKRGSTRSRLPAGSGPPARQTAASRRMGGTSDGTSDGPRGGLPRGRRRWQPPGTTW